MQYKIADLKNVSNGSEWSITARVLTKSEIIPFASGDGIRFTTILFDKTTEIGATAFGQDADRLFSQLQENEVYNIKNGEIKKAVQEYTTSNNAYEIIFNGSTIITDIPIHPLLTTIKDVFSMEINTFIDTIGVIIKIEEPTDKQKNNSNETYTLRNIILADRTSRVTVTLWGKEATDFNANEGDIMSIIRGKIIYFKNVKKITVTGSSKIVINPDWNETSDLQIWYNEEHLNRSQVSIGSQELNMVESLTI